jgi:hypothetical protein
LGTNIIYKIWKIITQSKKVSVIKIPKHRDFEMVVDWIYTVIVMQEPT